MIVVAMFVPVIGLVYLAWGEFSGMRGFFLKEINEYSCLALLRSNWPEI